MLCKSKNSLFAGMNLLEIFMDYLTLNIWFLIVLIPFMDLYSMARPLLVILNFIPKNHFAQLIVSKMNIDISVIKILIFAICSNSFVNGTVIDPKTGKTLSFLNPSIFTTTTSPIPTSTFTTTTNLLPTSTFTFASNFRPTITQ
ncbi:hypothetical protein F8M41_001043 [Gigaspora margarita]|uniref:Uncharacterized protein n=1 Tax=Gigaspora margarita TaxID=4874 RepID=A0A8H4AAE1_GIGMA|nr:hypothetical protein F8M41_001043 [Gigaspora margarita]